MVSIQRQLRIWPRASQRAAAVVLALCGAASGQSFQLLDRPAGARNAFSQAVSYDGSVVAGDSTVPSPNFLGPGWAWTATGGTQPIAGPGLAGNSGVYGISGDGRFVVGETGVSMSGLEPAIAYRYDRMTGAVVSIGVQAGGDRSRALGANLDGSVVVGYSSLDASLSFSQAFRWTQAGGLQPLGYARPEDHHSEALAVSADGNTVIGFSYGASGGAAADAFRWTPSGGMSILPVIPGATGWYRAHGMNQDASVMVGVLAPVAGVVRGVMWRDGVAIDLGTNGLVASYAYAVSDDGNVVVGQVEAGLDYLAGIWTPARGFEPLSTYLAYIGVTVPDGVVLRSATAISRDGRTIVGYTGALPDNTARSWVVTIPAPASAPLLMCILLFTCRHARARAGSLPSLA